jgi:hypothetical protein
MAGNEFDTSVMPSSRVARARERHMVGALPIYLIIMVLLMICIFGAVMLAISAR